MKKTTSIRQQIMNGYLVFVFILFVGVGLSVLSLILVKSAYERMETCSSQQLEAQKIISAHYQWLEQLSNAINTGENFDGSLDPATCSLGKWLNESEADLNQDDAIKNALLSINEPHRQLHEAAKAALDRSKSDLDAAYSDFQTGIRPRVTQVYEGLTEVSRRLGEVSDQQRRFTSLLYLISVVALCIFGTLCILLAVILGRKISSRISTPITTVAEWSEALTAGVDNLRFETESNFEETSALEIRRLLSSFQEMANNIRSHVEVIKRVAAGDLTAYVEIKSDGDSLGRSLYHLVQNNDFMFADLLRVADSVAVSADEIAAASQLLAQSSSTQASAVEALSSTVDRANHLAARNAGDAGEMSQRIEAMQRDVWAGQEEMDNLIASVSGIEDASGKISMVMKSINDIAFQTNILALNAAVEAARAGAAGKGFAVVADEVRQLAMKSADAADKSRVLIEDSIKAAKNGGVISARTARTFQSIVERIGEISSGIEKIDGASIQQQEMMQQIHDEIEKISNAVTENAASSEQTAASTQQMTSHADQIRAAMKRFNLRKRITGSPYIPPEKMHDPEFVKIATENYQKARGGKPQAMQAAPGDLTGRGGKETALEQKSI